MLYAEVIVDITSEALDRPFSYIIPEEMEKEIAVGASLRVPFGTREVRGFCIGISDRCEMDPGKMKTVSAVVTDEETAEARLVALAVWMSRTYGGVLTKSLRVVLPTKKKMNPLMIRRAFLTDREAAKNYREKLTKRQKKRADVIDSLLLEDGQLVSRLVAEYGVTLPIIRGLEKDGVISVLASEKVRRAGEFSGRAGAPVILTPEQAKAVSDIRREWREKKRPVLLSGITGSGKTLVYMELIADALREGKQAIVLIPEIALTAQTVRRFVERFGMRVSFLHSRLSEGEKYDQMKAARRGDLSIMVGPRSALFTPFRNLGLIVIDEEHEETYRSELVPRYHARETAVERAGIEGANVLMGSATPSLTASYRVETGEYAGVSLGQRYGEAILPETVIVDMRKEAMAGRRSIFSEILRDRIRECVDRGEQCMLFLNRRGYAGFVSCRACGHVVKCPHCDVSLTRHKNGRLICHYCGYEMPDMNTCPECGSSHFGGLTLGTEQVEEMVHAEFPGIRTLRMDYDTTRGKEGHTKILADFGAGSADVLIGTQMIVKGHDFPNVTLVGVLMADLSLNADDYRSAERTYQLVTQAVGRAGRGKKRGCAVIQTFAPDHYAVRSAANQAYAPFYREEIAYRRILHYPPVGTMMAVLGSCENEKLLSTGMTYLKKFIARIDPGNALMAIGPAPQSVGKVRDRYRQVIYLRHERMDYLILARDKILEYIEINSGFEKIRVEFDMNV